MKKTQVFSLILTLLIATALTSCEGPHVIPCEKGEGDRITEIRDIGGFNEIVVEIDADVHITKGETFSMEIVAQENILDVITTSLSGDLLEISSERCIKRNKPIEVFISMPELSMVEVKGSGDVFAMEDFDEEDVQLRVMGSGSIEYSGNAYSLQNRITGSGDITAHVDAELMETRITGSGSLDLEGGSNEHEIDISGSGDVRAFDADVNRADVHIRGSGDAFLTVIETLDVKITGSGDVHYYGNPEVDSSITGSGQVIKED